MTGHRCPPMWDGSPWAAPFSWEVLEALDSRTTTWCDPCRLRYVDMLTEAADRGSRCFMANHDDYPHEFDRLRATLRAAWRQHDAALQRVGGRYRAAWLSARRRAATLPTVRDEAYRRGWQAALDYLLTLTNPTEPETPTDDH